VHLPKDPVRGDSEGDKRSVCHIQQVDEFVGKRSEFGQANGATDRSPGTHLCELCEHLLELLTQERLPQFERLEVGHCGSIRNVGSDSPVEVSD